MAQGPNGDAGEDKSLSPNGETESIRSRSSSIRIEVSKPEEEHEQVKEVSSKIQDLNEQLEESIPEEINVQVEESILHEFNEQDKDDIPQDLKEVPEEHIKTPEEQLPGKISTQPSFSNSDNITVTEWQKDLINSPFPEAKVDGLLSRTPSKKIEETEPQDLKEKTEEQMENLTDIYADKFESRSSLYLPVQSRKKKRRKACNTEPRIFSKTYRNLRMPPKTSLLTRTAKPKTVDKAIQCNKLLMPRLPLPGTIPPPRSLIQKAKPIFTEDKTTEISPSFERLRRSTPPWIIKRRTEDNIISRVSPRKTSPSSLPQKSRCHYKKVATASTVSPPFSTKGKREQKPNVTYNLYINVSDDNWKGLGPGSLKGSCWEGNACSGLAKACSVFSNIKYGRIHVSKLRPALHTLEVLVTSDEMHQTLTSVNVDEFGTLNFFEFLEAVNRTSPFAEIDAFQNTLRAFRQVKTGTVAVGELRSVLTDLEVYMSPEEIQQALDRIHLDKNKKVNLSEFLLAARDLQTSLGDEDLEDECSFMQRKPFHDVAGLINVDTRWRKNYQSYFDEDASSTASLFPFLALPGSDENITQPQKSESKKLENGITDMKKSQSDIRRQSSKSKIEGRKESQVITERSNSQLDVIEEKHETEDVTEVQKSQSKVDPSSQDN
ncbi:uncharacterized protein LOC107983003 isoform X2 [Anolis carolinensis]